MIKFAALAGAILLGSTGTVAAQQTLPPLRILITNDDGIDSEGIKALVTALQPFATVTVSAPAVNHSGAGQSVTIFTRPIRVDARQVSGVPGYSVHGSPADSVIYGLLGPQQEKPPFDLVISGINEGENVGGATFVSGTVGAARQAAMIGIPAIAVSQQHVRDRPYDYRVAARFTAQLAQAMHRLGARAPALVSVNVPTGTPKGVKQVRAGGMPFQMTGVVREGEVDGAPAYRLKLGGTPIAPAGSDTAALNEGYITVTVLGLDPNGATDGPRRLPRSALVLPR